MIPERVIATTMLETREDLLALVPENAVIAELGVFTGGFSSRILRVCEPAELHLIDMWEGRGERDGQVVDDMAVVYLALALRGDRRYTLHRAKAVDALSTFPDLYFDFVYIDSSKDETTVYADLVMAMHKTMWGIGGRHYYGDVQLAVDMFCADWRWELTHLTKEDCSSYMLRPPQSGIKR